MISSTCPTCNKTGSELGQNGMCDCVKKRIIKAEHTRLLGEIVKMKKDIYSDIDNGFNQALEEVKKLLCKKDL